MYSVEAEYIDRVVAEFGPCACVVLSSRHMLSLVHSDEARSHRLRTDVRKGA
jgi:hypothetical protein